MPLQGVIGTDGKYHSRDDGFRDFKGFTPWSRDNCSVHEDVKFAGHVATGEVIGTSRREVRDWEKKHGKIDTTGDSSYLPENIRKEAAGRSYITESESRLGEKMEDVRVTKSYEEAHGFGTGKKGSLDAMPVLSEKKDESYGKVIGWKSMATGRRT